VFCCAFEQYNVLPVFFFFHHHHLFFSIQLYLTPADWLALRPDQNERDSSIHYTNVSRSRVPAGLQPTRTYNTINQRIGITGPGGGAPPHRRVFVAPQHTRNLLNVPYFFLSFFPYFQREKDQTQYTIDRRKEGPGGSFISLSPSYNQKKI
jgi:hypothetical protein